MLLVKKGSLIAPLLKHAYRNRVITTRSASTTTASHKPASKVASKNSPDTNHDIDTIRRRNIGIVAHINAGKTTTTERILYLAGTTDHVGDVDKGNTVTDYLVQERDRGITITSAAVTFNWKKHRINLIDTPGHVDFTYEVERSVSVLDGAITILDASAGVEAQTISVWNQADKYKLPNIIFLNKYDKPMANVDMCLKDLKRDLNIRANLIQIPIKLSQHKAASNFTSIIDIIRRQVITWSNAELDKGTKYESVALKDFHIGSQYIESVEREREKLVNTLCDLDENLASHVIECDKIGDVSDQLIVEALRHATLKCKLSPVLVGSSFKYIGVQQLMDSVLDYLPSPIDRNNQIDELMINQRKANQHTGDKNDCGFIFKIMHDKRLGALNYLRIYNGTFSSLKRVKNLESGEKVEQVKKVYRAFADELRELDKPVGKDDIIVVTGLTSTRTGDILVDQSFNLLSNQRLENETKLSTHEQVVPFQLLNDHIVLPQISRMEPVYFCSIEAKNASHQIKLEQALACMTREDPSFTYEIDSMGITTIRGMGKLHLEVARDRIRTEYGVESTLGRLQISYRETIDGSANEELSVNRLINSVNNSLFIKLYIRAKVGAGQWSGKHLRLDTAGESSLGKLRSDHRKAIEIGFASALSHGPTLGFPMIDCDILLLDFKANNRCGYPVISSSASQCLMNAIKRCSPVLLEPIMSLEVVAPKDHNGIILSDITSTRRGIVISTQAKTIGTIIIRAHVPLAALSDYSEFLRITTSGRGSFSMELHKYAAMSETDKQSVVKL